MAKTTKAEKKQKPKTIRMGFKSEIVDLLKRAGEPFTMHITNSTIKIVKENGDKYILSAKDLSFKTLAFIRSVKLEGLAFSGKIIPTPIFPFTYYKPRALNYWPALDFNWNAFKLFLPKIKARDINYFRWNAISLGTHYDVFEVDVNNAYWNTALQMGVISPAIYCKGLNDMQKMDRLISLGSLATRTEIFKFDPETNIIKHIEPKVNEFTRNIFFNIAKRIDYLLSDIFDKAGANNVHFYWVDALFCRKYSLDFIKAEFEKRGIEYKVKEIKSMNVYKKGRETKVCILEVKEKNETYYTFEQRFFSIPPPQEQRMEFIKEMFLDSMGDFETEPLTQDEIDKIIEKEKYGDNVPF